MRPCALFRNADRGPQVALPAFEAFSKSSLLGVRHAAEVRCRLWDTQPLPHTSLNSEDFDKARARRTAHARIDIHAAVQWVAVRSPTALI
jgi:hypothetical protein